METVSLIAVELSYSRGEFVFLSIAVPVYNQAGDLLRTLESLDLVGLTEHNQVEILISDNGSSDKTPSIAFSWAAKYQRSFAYSQEVNIGFSGNFDFLAQKASGQYLWVIGAGDVLVGRSLESLFELLEVQEPDWAVVNGNYSDTEVSFSGPYFEVGDTKRTCKVPVFSHAVSLNIIKTDLARQRIRQDVFFDTASVTGRRTNIGTLDIWEGETRYWPHLESIANQLLSSSAIPRHWLYFKPKTVHPDMNDHGSWDRGFSALKIYVQWVEIVHSAARRLEQSAWLDDLSNELRGHQLLRMLFLIRKDGNIRRSELLKNLREIPQIDFFTRILAWSVISTPIWLARIVAHVRREIVLRLAGEGK